MSEEQVETQVEVTEEPSYEAEAEAQGWVPKESFRGSENDWVDAETFVRRGREILPIVRKHNERLVKELAEAKRGAEEVREAAKEFREFQKTQFAKKTKELEQQLEQLKQAKREAITQGDGDRAIAIDDAMDDLKEQRVEAKEELKRAEEKAKEPPPVTEDPLLNEWISKNDWFGSDEDMTDIANALGTSLRRKTPSLQGKDFLDKLDEKLVEKFPDRFGKKKSTPNPMEGSQRESARPVSGGKKSYNSLPEDAKKACDRFVKQGLMTREEYVNDYDWN